jgi:uncharacterized protein with von Willebrand factor type A (vWA) domain
VWLQRLRETFKYSLWLNPIPQRSWDYIQTTRMIKNIFPMFELTLEGLDEAIKHLVSGKVLQKVV